MLYDDDHGFIGSKLEALASDMRKNGRADIADGMTAEGWVKVQADDGGCMAQRADSTHVIVWCWRDAGHDGEHGPACPRCEIVKDVMRTVAVHLGDWGT